MKNLKTFKVTPLTSKEILEVNGGESGWYYLARLAKAVTLAITAGFTVPEDSAQNASGLGGSRPFE